MQPSNGAGVCAPDFEGSSADPSPKAEVYPTGGLKRGVLGAKGVRALTLGDCPSCGLVETIIGERPVCGECSRPLPPNVPPLRGDVMFDGVAE